MMTETTTEEFVSRKDAAKLLHVDIRTIDRYAASGRLKKYRRSAGRLIGNRVVFKSMDVLSLKEPQPQE